MDSSSATQPAPMQVRCRTCHRLERWQGDQRAVEVVGGARRTQVPPQLAAWEVLKEWHHRQCLAPVAACPACGQPMVADDPAQAPIPWTFDTPEGAIVVEGHQVRGPEGSMSWEEADALILRHYRPPRRWLDWLGPGALLQSAAVGTIAGPALLLWMAAILTVVVFMLNVLQ